MLGLAEIEYLVKLAIHTPFIKNEKPVSLMIIAPTEHGKSDLLKKFTLIDSVKISSDFNTSIFEDLVGEIELGKIKTIIFPDFLRLTKRKYSTQANILTIINTITEEGWIGRLPLSKRLIMKPLIVNIITALTRAELEDKRHKWAKIGFLSRFLPISYSYSSGTKGLIREYIKDRKYSNDKPADFELSNTIKDITLPRNLAEKIKNISLKISEKENILGFRLQKQLQTLCMANCLARGQELTSNEDVKVIENLSKYINYKFVKI